MCSPWKLTGFCFLFWCFHLFVSTGKQERLHNKTEKPLDTSLATSKYNLSDKADVAASKNLTASGRSEISDRYSIIISETFSSFFHSESKTIQWS
ncbi:hypothetical protein SLE2022_299350 [Rubroshorea leprosula]